MPPPFETSAVTIATVLTIIGALGASGLLDAIRRALFEERDSRVTGLARRERPKSESVLAQELALEVAAIAANSSGVVRTLRFNVAKQQVLVRIRDTREAQKKQQSLARRSRWSANSLTIGQYVIGAVLATSFVQQSLSPQIVGVFGLLVVTASVLKQHYHPDLTAQNADQRAGELEALIRQSEDQLVVIETTMESGTDDPAPVLELLERISSELTRITQPSAQPRRRGK